jgi:hypothetical protein
MTVTIKSLKFEPAPDGDAYRRILKDPESCPPELQRCPLGKWHNPDGQHFTLDVAPDHPWYWRDVKAGALVAAKGGRRVKKVATPMAEFALLGASVLTQLCRENGISIKGLYTPPMGVTAMAKALAAKGVKVPVPETEEKINTEPAPKDGEK